MSRTFMMVILVVGIVTISYAGQESFSYAGQESFSYAGQEPFNQLCMGGSQQPPIIQDCTDSKYKNLIYDRVHQTERLLDEKARNMKELLEKIENEARVSFFPYDISNLTKLEHYFDDMVRIQEKVIKRTHKDDHSERECKINEFKFILLSSHLSYLDGQMRFLCQFYSQAFMQQKNEGNQGKPSSSLAPATGFTIKKQN